MLPARLACDHRVAQTPLRSQGPRNTCGSFAATAAHEWMSGHALDLSEEDAIWAAEQVAPNGSEAAFVRDVLAGMTRHGHALSTDWPYGQPLYTQGRPAAAQNVARQLRCGAHAGSPAADVAALAAILDLGHAPVVDVAFVPETWLRATADGWVDDPQPPARGAHAVLVVGAVTASGSRPDAVIFKNSWDVRWGDHGFGYVTDRYLQSHHRHTDVLRP